MQSKGQRVLAAVAAAAFPGPRPRPRVELSPVHVQVRTQGDIKKQLSNIKKTTTATTTHACLFPSKKHWKGRGRGEWVGVTHSHTQQGCISLAHKKLAHIFRVTLFLYGLPACLHVCLPHIKGQSTLWNKCLIGSGSAPLTLDLAGTQTPHSRGEFPL